MKLLVDKHPPENTVYNWFAEFRGGRALVTDESREGRPKLVMIPENIDDVRKMIEEDRHVMYCEVEATLVYHRLQYIRF